MTSFLENLPADLAGDLADQDWSSSPFLAPEMKAALKCAMAQLTEKEREFLFSREIACQPSRRIRSALGLGSRQNATWRWQILRSILQIYILYFVGADHNETLETIPSLGAAGPILLDIFNGRPRSDICKRHKVSRREINQALRVYSINQGLVGPPSLRDFVEVVLKLNLLKRL